MTEARTLRVQDLPVELRRTNAWRGVADLALVWTAIAVLVSLAGAVRHPVAFLAAVVLIGGLQNNLASLTHHATHFNLHPSRSVNDWLARLFLAAPLGSLFSVVRSEHWAHHARLGAADDPERFYYDLDLHGRRVPGRLRIWVLELFAGWVLLPAVRRFLTGSRAGTPAAAGPREPAETRFARVEVALLVVAQLAIALGWWELTGAWWGYLALWVLPLVTVGAALTALRATLEHADPRRPPHLLLSFVSNPVERFFVGPFNFNYHYEHHRFMMVPYYRMARVRRLLLDAGDYQDGELLASYAGRLGWLVRTLQPGPPA